MIEVSPMFTLWISLDYILRCIINELLYLKMQQIQVIQIRGSNLGAYYCHGALKPWRETFAKRMEK